MGKLSLDSSWANSARCVRRRACSAAALHADRSQHAYDARCRCQRRRMEMTRIEKNNAQTRGATHYPAPLAASQRRGMEVDRAGDKPARTAALADTKSQLDGDDGSCRPTQPRRLTTQSAIPIHCSDYRGSAACKTCEGISDHRKKKLTARYAATHAGRSGCRARASADESPAPGRPLATSGGSTEASGIHRRAPGTASHEGC